MEAKLCRFSWLLSRRLNYQNGEGWYHIDRFNTATFFVPVLIQNLNFQHRGFVDIGESVDHRCLSVLSIIILFTNYALCLLFYKKRERVNKERKYATGRNSHLNCCLNQFLNTSDRFKPLSNLTTTEKCTRKILFR